MATRARTHLRLQRRLWRVTARTRAASSGGAPVPQGGGGGSAPPRAPTTATSCRHLKRRPRRRATHTCGTKMSLCHRSNPSLTTTSRRSSPTVPLSTRHRCRQSVRPYFRAAASLLVLGCASVSAGSMFEQKAVLLHTINCPHPLSWSSTSSRCSTSKRRVRRRLAAVARPYGPLTP